MPTVLIVDDDVGVRKLARLVMTMEGKDVCEASDGAEALEVLSHEAIDLMVLDLEMPRLDGKTTFREARRVGFEGPVLILSAFGARTAAREIHADDALDKPFEPDELVSHVNNLLARPDALALDPELADQRGDGLE